MASPGIRSIPTMNNVYILIGTFKFKNEPTKLKTNKMTMPNKKDCTNHFKNFTNFICFTHIIL